MVEEQQTAGATPGTPGPAFGKTLEDLLIALRRSSKDLAFYPEGHPQLQRSLERALDELKAAVGSRATLQLTVSRTGFAFEGRPVGAENRQLATMAAELFVRRIQRIFFAPGVGADDLAAFLRVITADPKQLLQQGGPGKVLAAQGAGRIQVNEFDFRRVGGAAAPAGRGAGTGGQEASGPGGGGGRPGAGPGRGGPGTGGQATPGRPAAPSAGMRSDGAQAGRVPAAGSGAGRATMEEAAAGGAGSSQAAQAEAGAAAPGSVPSPGQELLASLASRKGPKERTVEALIERLEQEATSGTPGGYEWAAAQLEAAADQAIAEDQLGEVLAILESFLRHRQGDGLKPAVRERAARAIQTIAGEEALAYLVGHLDPGAGGSVEELPAVLVGLGPRVIPPLLDRLTLADQAEARAALVATLARFLEVARGEVTGALQQAERDQAGQLAVSIGAVGGEAGVGLLAPLARHRDATVRREAVRGLGRIGAPSVHRHLLQALRDPDPAVVEAAVGFVGTAKVKLAIPTLLRLASQRALAGQPFAVRKAAVAALGAMGDPGSIATLTGLLYTRTWFKRAAGDELRQTAALALLDTGRPEGRQAVEDGMRSRRGDVRRACDAALRKQAEDKPGQG